MMDRRNISALVNLTGGFGDGVRSSIQKFDTAHPGRFYTFTEPSYNRFLEPNYSRIQAEAIAEAHFIGARGLKILKTLGLYLRENLTSGKLVQVDDPRFDADVGCVRTTRDACRNSRIRSDCIFQSD